MPYVRNIGAYTQDEQNALLGNSFVGPYTIAASGAIDPHTPGRYVITKATVAALTLGAPLAGVEDGLQITVYSDTAAAHTITATGLFADGAGHVNLCTFAAQIGAQAVMIARNGKWYIDGAGITVS